MYVPFALQYNAAKHPRNPFLWYLESHERSDRGAGDTHGPDRHSMNTSETVASEVAAPASSETAAPAPGQESVDVGPAGPDGLSVATPARSAASGKQLPYKNPVESRRG